MITFQIITPDGVTYEDEIPKVTIPTLAGEITVLPEHMSMVSVLRAGTVIIYKEDGSKIELAVSSGVLEIREHSRVFILTDTAERAEDIDIERAEAARARAEELLQEQENIADVDFARIQAAIEKETARISVGKKYRKLNV